MIAGVVGPGWFLLLNRFKIAPAGGKGAPVEIKTEPKDETLELLQILLVFLEETAE